MSAVVFPDAVSSFAGRKVVALTAAPSNLAAATVVEAEAGVTAGLELTMFLLSPFVPSGSQNKGTSPRRVGERTQLQRLGAATQESPTLQYIHDPQGAPTATANKPKTALVSGTMIWVLERPGIPSDTAWTATQRYRLHILRTGEQFYITSGDGEFDIEIVQQETEYVAAPTWGVLA